MRFRTCSSDASALLLRPDTWGGGHHGLRRFASFRAGWLLTLAALVCAIFPATAIADPTVVLYNVTRGGGSTYYEGDSWQILINGGEADYPVYVHLPEGEPCLEGYTDGNGHFELSGSFTSNEVGGWDEYWQVGNTDALPSPLSFEVLALPEGHCEASLDFGNKYQYESTDHWEYQRDLSYRPAWIESDDPGAVTGTATPDEERCTITSYDVFSSYELYSAYVTSVEDREVVWNVSDAGCNYGWYGVRACEENHPWYTYPWYDMMEFQVEVYDAAYQSFDFADEAIFIFVYADTY